LTSKFPAELREYERELLYLASVACPMERVHSSSCIASKKAGGDRPCRHGIRRVKSAAPVRRADPSCFLVSFEGHMRHWPLAHPYRAAPSPRQSRICSSCSRGHCEPAKFLPCYSAGIRLELKIYGPSQVPAGKWHSHCRTQSHHANEVYTGCRF